MIRREDRARAHRQQLPDYSDILQVPDVDHADDWMWEWRGPEEDLELRERRQR